MTRVRVQPGWGAFDGCEGELVLESPDGWVLVRLDGEERPLRFDEDAVVELSSDEV